MYVQLGIVAGVVALAIGCGKLLKRSGEQLDLREVKIVVRDLISELYKQIAGYTRPDILLARMEESKGRYNIFLGLRGADTRRGSKFIPLVRLTVVVLGPDAIQRTKIEVHVGNQKDEYDYQTTPEGIKRVVERTFEVINN